PIPSRSCRRRLSGRRSVQDDRFARRPASFLRVADPEQRGEPERQRTTALPVAIVFHDPAARTILPFALQLTMHSPLREQLVASFVNPPSSMSNEKYRNRHSR